MQFLEDADHRLARYFENGYWDIYDGVTVAQDSCLTITDIIVSVGLNSQVDTRKKIWHIWQQKPLIDRALSKIPQNISLTETDIPWQELKELFKVFCQAKYAKGAVATKILHKKRPHLIPVYDKIIGDFFQKRMTSEQWNQQWHRFLVSYMQVFRELLLQYEPDILAIRDRAEKTGASITPVRTLEVLIWIAQKRDNDLKNSSYSDIP